MMMSELLCFDFECANAKELIGEGGVVFRRIQGVFTICHPFQAGTITEQCASGMERGGRQGGINRGVGGLTYGERCCLNTLAWHFSARLGVVL